MSEKNQWHESTFRDEQFLGNSEETIQAQPAQRATKRASLRPRPKNSKGSKPVLKKPGPTKSTDPTSVKLGRYKVTKSAMEVPSTRQLRQRQRNEIRKQKRAEKKHAKDITHHDKKPSASKGTIKGDNIAPNNTKFFNHFEADEIDMTTQLFP